MAYKKTVWKDGIFEKPKTFRKQDNADGTFTLVPAFGQVLQEGTMVNADHMNNIENGIESIEKKVEGITPVTSVNTQTGAVVLSANDIKTTDGKTVESQLAEKATKQPTATENNITVFDNIGNIKDSGKAIGNTSGKILELPTGLAKGDLLRVGANRQIERLPKGTDGQGLVLNNGLPIWGSAGLKMVSGTYNGDGVATKTINIGFTPKLVFLTSLLQFTGRTQAEILFYDGSGASMGDKATSTSSTVAFEQFSSQQCESKIISNGFTVQQMNSNKGMNISGVSYGYIAIG